MLKQKEMSDLKTGHWRATDVSMRHEICRFATFLGYPHRKPFPTSFVSAGFYSIKEEDKVACFECGLTVGQWKPDDDPLGVHKRLSPRCKFINQTTDFCKTKKTTCQEENSISGLHGATGFTARVPHDNADQRREHDELEHPGICGWLFEMFSLFLKNNQSKSAAL